MWDRTSGRRRWAFLGQPAHCGTKPSWVVFGRHCGSRPNRGSAFLGHRWWDQTKVGFSWTALWDRTKPNAEEGGLFLNALVEPTTQDQTRPDQTRPDKSKADAGEVGFSSTPSWNRPRQTRPDKPKADAGGGGLFFDALAEPDHARPDQTRQNQSRRGRKVGFSWTPLWNQTTPDQTRPDKPKADAGGRWAFLGRPCGTRPDQARPDQK